MMLKALKGSFEHLLKENIPHLGEKNTLRDACEYALLGGGKRVRPLIVLLVGSALGKGLDLSEAALCVEYFHTASLIADDLPCMDNDDYRRSQKALHKEFGEGTALLASYALISAGYEKICRSTKRLSKASSPLACEAHVRGTIALDAATRCAGIRGATGGQFKDLFGRGESWEEIVDVIYKKTITLFEVSFVLGGIFGGIELSLIEELCALAYHFGLAFQIADDLGDCAQDREGAMNSALFLGREEALRRFHSACAVFTNKLEAIELMTPEFEQLIELLIAHAEGAAKASS